MIFFYWAETMDLCPGVKYFEVVSKNSASTTDNQIRHIYINPQFSGKQQLNVITFVLVIVHIHQTTV